VLWRNLFHPRAQTGSMVVRFTPRRSCHVSHAVRICRPYSGHAMCWRWLSRSRSQEKEGGEMALFAPALRGDFAGSRPLRIFGPRMAVHEFESRVGAISLMKKAPLLSAQMTDALGARARSNALPKGERGCRNGHLCAAFAIRFSSNYVGRQFHEQATSCTTDGRLPNTTDIFCGVCGRLGLRVWYARLQSGRHA
jgi:hypothetical protein